MTPAERDEVRRIAQDSTAIGGADVNECDVNALARAVLRYVPAGDVYDCGIEIFARGVLIPVNAADLRNGMWWHSPATARVRAHALHAAADAAEETTR